jgi:translation initiation factor 2 subunit 2
MNYEQLLDEAYENVKVSEGSGERFKMIDVKVEITGNKTVIANFSQILSHIRRKPEEFCKFLSKELASQCKSEGDRLIFNRRIPPQKVIEKVNLYVSKFVLCKECGKPDTEIQREGGLAFMHCLACGAKHSLGNL